jgi:hypothetical protein
VALHASGPQGEPRIRYSGMVRLTPQAGGPTLQLPYLFTSVNLPIAAGSVLYVDDSGHDRPGADYDNPASSPPSNPTSTMVTQIKATGRTVEYWDRLFYGEPSLADLKAARSVVWSFLSGAGDFANLTNNGTLSGTELATMQAYLDGGGRLDVDGEIFAAQVLAAYASFAPTGTVVPNHFATFDTFLQDRFGFAVLNGGAALDPLGGGLDITGVPGDPIGDGISGTLEPSLIGGRDTLSLVGPAAPTFRVASPPPTGSDIIGDRTSYEPSIASPGHVQGGRPGRTTFETFSTAALPGSAGLEARSRILDELEDEVTASASLSAAATGSGNDRRMTVSVQASSSHGTISQYVYDFGDGSPLVTSTQPTVTHPQRGGGHGPVTVQVTDSFDHSVVVTAG